MRRPLNLWLIVIVVICGASIWFGRGIKLPGFKRNPVPEAVVSSDHFAEQDILPNIHLLILNGTEIVGLAREFSLMVSRIGCVAQGTGNAPTKPWVESILINRRLSDECAQQLAIRLGGIVVLREFDGRTTEDAVLVLGQDYHQMRENLLPRNLLGEKSR